MTGVVWSPDGRQIAYHVRKIDGELIYKVSADGAGARELVFKLPGFGLSLTDWSPDGRYLIYYSQQLAGNRLFALPVTPEPKPIEIMKSDLPINSARISPDGRLIAYQSTESAESPKQGIYVRTLDLAAGKTGETAQQVKGDPSFGMGLGVSWRQDGRELYYLAPKHAVMAVDVTASPALAAGNATALFSVPDATNDAQGIGLWWGNVARDGQRVVYSVAPKGASAPTDPTFQLAILDRQGKVLRRVGPIGRYGQTALSPDGTRIATRWFDTFAPGGRSDIWVVDIASGKTTPITNDAPPDFAPLWSPDGKQIFYVSARAGGYQGIYRKAADGTGDAELIYRYNPGAPVNLRDISADGKHLLFNSGGVILVVPMAGDAKTRKAIELSREEFVVNGGVFSPDGRSHRLHLERDGSLRAVCASVRCRDRRGGRRHKVSRVEGGRRRSDGLAWRRPRALLHGHRARSQGDGRGRHDLAQCADGRTERVVSSARRCAGRSRHDAVHQSGRPAVRVRSAG